MKNAESLKAKIREIALKKHLNSMEVLQMYFFERFLDRLSKSKYKFNFVINNPDAEHRGMCSHKVVAVGFNTLRYDTSVGVLNPPHE